MAASCSMPSAVSLPTVPMMAAIGPLRACAVEGAPTLPGPGAASLRAGHSCLVSTECMAPPQRMLGGRKTKTRRGARRQQIPIVMKWHGRCLPQAGSRQEPADARPESWSIAARLRGRVHGQRRCAFQGRRGREPGSDRGNGGRSDQHVDDSGPACANRSAIGRIARPAGGCSSGFSSRGRCSVTWEGIRVCSRM